MNDKKAVLEGLLFLAGEEGIDFITIQKVLDIDGETLTILINEFDQSLKAADRGLMLVELGNKYKLSTKSIHHNYYEKLVENNSSFNFTNATLETLAIIAYKQPVTRVDVEQVRGVNSDSIIRRLLANSLIKEVGRKETLGRPLMYEVTSEFLDVFNLQSIEELPKIDLENENLQQQNIFNTKFNEE
ncbi:SMC-Scp complex subunit ScpB [Mycoplasma sp. P36-A1]|uniref:SMC-Scp complex subunit ScpB n=1 Tax=Mycoplasma sp. P36-A1 TaxID=3252900 RepID=UPI003C2DA4E5